MDTTCSYNRYLYRLSVQAVLITDRAKNSISPTNIIADLIFGTSLLTSRTKATIRDQACTGLHVPALKTVGK